MHSLTQDVVTANPETWSFDPFQLTRDGDKLQVDGASAVACPAAAALHTHTHTHTQCMTPPSASPPPRPRSPQGRGVTDCLGHVALLAELFVQLGSRRPPLGPTVVGVFIANEENATLPGIGVDEMVKRGLLDRCRCGGAYCVDPRLYMVKVAGGTLPGVRPSYVVSHGRARLPLPAVAFIWIRRNGPLYWIDTADSQVRAKFLKRKKTTFSSKTKKTALELPRAPPHAAGLMAAGHCATAQPPTPRSPVIPPPRS